uniref:Transcription factor CBF/NF-Y/archaeal histone domain-containing protein n=1 Tax=Peronospora matthiolae TaxID=2874970 RepID=A0AAV1UBN1_9STRA
MANPTEAGTASTSAQLSAPASALASPKASDDQAKTKAHRPAHSVSSIMQQEPQNIADKAKWTPPHQAITIETLVEAKSSGNDPISAASAHTKASVMNPLLQAQKESNRLHISLAQQQVQLYPTMAKRAGATTTPSTIGNNTSNSSSIASTNRIFSSTVTATNTITTAPATIAGSSTRSTVGIAGTKGDDLQKLQQTQIATSQQIAQQSAMVTGDKWLQRKLELEQERAQQRQRQKQQRQGSNGNSVTRKVLSTSIADSLLVQQQHVIQQQQMLRDVLQKQQQHQQAQLQLQMKWRQGVSKGGTQSAQPAASSTATTAASNTVLTAAPTCFSVKKKVVKDTIGMDLEALARVCIRVANARTESEMRPALEKMTSWLHRCTELPLLQLAQREYNDSMALRRPTLVQQNRWPLDLQVKSEYITHKIVQLLGVLMLREKNQAAQQQRATALRAAAAVKSTVAAPASSATTTADGVVTSRPAAAYAGATATALTVFPRAAITTTSASRMVASDNTSFTTASSSAVATSSTRAAVALKPVTLTQTRVEMASSSCSMTPDQSARAPVKRDMAWIERAYADLKDQLQAKQVEINQKAKVKRDAAKVDTTNVVTITSNRELAAATVPATYKRPMQCGVPDAAKKQCTDVHAVSSSLIAAAHRPPTTSVPPISPQLAQQFYEFDSTRRTSSEPEDKMYMPSKIVSKIMHKALPRVQEENAGVGDIIVKRQEQTKSKGVSAATFASHRTLDHESRFQDTVRISDEAVTFMQECVTEFLLYFTSEARDLSVMQNRRTKKGVGLSISGSNVVESMENLGFTPYAHVLARYNEKVKASQDAAARKKMQRRYAAQQQALQKQSVAASSAVAVNAAKTAAVATGKSAVLPYLSANEQSKSVTSFSGVTTAMLSRPSSSVLTVSRSTSVPTAGTGIVTAQPIVAATTTLSSNPAIERRQQPQLHQQGK